MAPMRIVGPLAEALALILVNALTASAECSPRQGSGTYGSVSPHGSFSGQVQRQGVMIRVRVSGSEPVPRLRDQDQICVSLFSGRSTGGSFMTNDVWVPEMEGGWA